MKIFKIVCEGNTDFEVMKPIAEEIGKLNKDNYKAKVLFPPKKNSHAGWSNLRAWCKEQASVLIGTHNAQQQIAANLLGAKPAMKPTARKVDLITAATLLAEDGVAPRIILQIDSDIAHDLLADIGIDKNDISIFPLHPVQRVKICENALDSWLGPHCTKKGTTIFYCITSFALENWILTLHTSKSLGISSNYDYDLIADPEGSLITLGYPSKVKDGIRRLKKDPPKYRIYGLDICKNIASSIQRSTSLKEYCNTLTNA